jgi:dTMP kinase
MCNPCEVLLYLASRAQHVSQTILPAVENGSVVLCDRFSDATFAYQGGGRKIPIALLRRLNDFASIKTEPALTFLLDISVECSTRRRVAAGKVADRLEGNDEKFYNAVRKGYLSLARQNPRRIIVLDGEQPAQELSEVIVGKICNALSKPRNRGGNHKMQKTSF